MPNLNFNNIFLSFVIIQQSNSPSIIGSLILFYLLLPQGSNAQGGASGTYTEHTLQHDGRTRTYDTYVPETASENSSLHVIGYGGLGSPESILSRTSYTNYADQYGIILLIPESVNYQGASFNYTAWNVNNICCGLAATQGTDDLGFVIRATNITYTSFNITGLIHFFGYSNGGELFANGLCGEGLPFSNIGSVGFVESAFYPDCLLSNTNNIPNVFDVRGTESDNRPFHGGYPQSGSLNYELDSFQNEVNVFTSSSNCNQRFIQIDGNYNISTFSNCDYDQRIVAMTITGGEHQLTSSQWTYVMDSYMNFSRSLEVHNIPHLPSTSSYPVTTKDVNSSNSFINNDLLFGLIGAGIFIIVFTIAIAYYLHNRYLGQQIESQTNETVNKKIDD